MFKFSVGDIRKLFKTLIQLKIIVMTISAFGY